jgi:hypothetical protein
MGRSLSLLVVRSNCDERETLLRSGGPFSSLNEPGATVSGCGSLRRRIGTRSKSLSLRATGFWRQKAHGLLDE